MKVKIDNLIISNPKSKETILKLDNLTFLFPNLKSINQDDLDDQISSMVKMISDKILLELKK